MTSEIVLKTLQESSLVQDLTPDQLQKLAAISHEAVFSEGQVIFRENDLGELVYLVREGQIAIEQYVPGQGRTTILTVGPDQILGWSALFPAARKTAGARAMEPTETIAINASQLRDLMHEDHDLGCTLLWRVAEVIANRLRATRLQLMDIFTPGKT
jgi:CRP-like cAMP-binding protein